MRGEDNFTHGVNFNNHGGGSFQLFLEKIPERHDRAAQARGEGRVRGAEGGG